MREDKTEWKGKTPSLSNLNYIRENYRYDPDTGLIWYARQHTGPGRKRNMDKPVGKKHPSGSPFVNLPDGSFIQLHRMAWFLGTGSWPPDDMVVDHINHDRADNRASNLRLATRQQNMRNRRKGSRKNEFKGIRPDSPEGPWRSQHCVDGEVFFGPPRATQEDAARDYDWFVYQIDPEFWLRNFPDETPQPLLNRRAC